MTGLGDPHFCPSLRAVGWCSVHVRWPLLGDLWGMVRHQHLPSSHLCPVGKHHSCGPCFSGLGWQSWHWDWPEALSFLTNQVLVSSVQNVPMPPPHIVAHPALATVFSMKPFSTPGPQRSSWFPSLMWGKGELYVVCRCLWPLGVTAKPQKPRKSVSPNWKHHDYVFKKCSTWKYLFSCSIKISFPKPHGLKVWLYEGYSGGTCVQWWLMAHQMGAHGGHCSDITLKKISIFFPFLWWVTDWASKWFQPLSSGLFS